MLLTAHTLQTAFQSLKTQTTNTSDQVFQDTLAKKVPSKSSLLTPPHLAPFQAPNCLGSGILFGFLKYDFRSALNTLKSSSTLSSCDSPEYEQLYFTEYVRNSGIKNTRKITYTERMKIT